MKLTYNQKFKDRSPTETINIIKQYFLDRNCFIKEKFLQESSGTFAGELELIYQNTRIGTSNGKGITLEFCKASAYAELYERFANKAFSLTNYILNQKIMQKSYELNGFYFDPNEKILTFEEAFNSDIGQYYLNNMCDDISELKEVFTFLMKQFIGIPYTNVNTGFIKYFDPRVLFCLTSTSGMAAGNNFYEAFNQGMSEIYEHIVNGKYLIDKSIRYYSLNLTNITNQNLQTIINTIQQDNDLYIFDFSYNYQIPVLMSLLINKQTHAVSVNLGAFPVFEIALERVLTELYQGTYSFNTFKADSQKPLKTYCDPRLVDAYWPGCTMTRAIFPEQIINNIEQVEQCSNVFLNGEYSNQDIYNYIQQINNQLNLEVYYYNCSLTSDMYAIKIFINNLPILLEDFSYGQLIQNKTNNFIFILKLMTVLENYIQSSHNNLNDLLPLIQGNFRYINKLDNHFINNILLNKNQFSVSAGFSHTQNVLELCEKIMYNTDYLLNSNEMPDYYLNTTPTLYKELIRYIIIKRYANSINVYTSNEILQLLDFLHITYTIEDIQAILNDDDLYWINTIAFTDLNKLKNNKYNDYIELIAKSVWSN